jgi:TRAP-type C4-dicarboxylate transport system substrate-binding protein
MARIKRNLYHASQKKRRSFMKRYVAKVSCFAVVAVLFCLLGSSVYSAEKVIRLRYAVWFPATHRLSVLIDQWCKDVDKGTNGVVKITPFMGGTLANPTQVYEGILKGSFDIGTSALAYNTGRFPLTEVLDLPLGYRDARQGTQLHNAFLQKFKANLKEFDEVKLFYLYCPGAGLIHTKKVVSGLEEIKGMRIRASGLNAKSVEALGAIPVTITIPETYDALQRGIVDGLLMHTEVLQTFRLGELAKCTIKDHGMSNGPAQFVAMNKKKWESLPKSAQQVILKLNEEYLEKFSNAAVEMDEEVYVYLKKLGNTVVTVSKEEQAKTAAKMKPVFDEYVQRVKAKANLPADEALKFCLEYLKTH